MSRTPIYIIADNIITPLGFTTRANVEKIAAGQTGIKCHSADAIYPSPVWVSKIPTKLLADAATQLSDSKSYTQLEQLFLLSISEASQQIALDIAREDTLIIIASTKGNINLLGNQQTGTFPKKRIQLGTMAAQIQSYFKSPNTPVVVCNACISGVLALDVAKRLLRKNKYKNIIVTGGDLVTEFTVSGFQSFKAMSDAPCKPYDKNRVGINLGEGIGTMILSTTPPKTQDPVITIQGGASSNDANHISGPSRTGEGLFLAIKKALRDANLKSSEIDYLSMHGTATPYNDEMECKALGLADLLRVPMNSLKGYIGHTLGAAGLIESIIAVHSLKNNTLYPSLGFEELGVTLPINVITKISQIELHKCLKTASGFGGCNAAVVFEKQKINSMQS
jgi:3-oxoacyl-[acyl-carrier-protein] synthase-1